jgi:hypothetical protein
MIESVRRFLAFCTSPPAEIEERMVQLAHLLDELLHTFHSTPGDVFDDRIFADPPSFSVIISRDEIAKRFPELAYYQLTEALDPKDPPVVLVADARDDVLDLANDLAEVEWRWRHTSEADAIWHFRFLFGAHWGRHAINLRSFLHARIYEG